MDTTEEDTLLTFSPSTGSLYALSSRRFPGVVKEVTPALAGLEEAERSSQALTPGGGGTRRGAHHHPMECTTFGCWLGRYKVNEEVFGDQEQTRRLLGPGMGRPTLDGGSDYQGPLRPPLGLPEGSSRPTEDQKQPESPFHQESPGLAQRTVSTLKKLGSSRNALATQAFALLFIVGLAILFRRGSQIREQLDMQKTEEIVREARLMWDPRVPTSNGAEAIDLPKDSSSAAIVGGESAPQELTQVEPDLAATSKKQGGATLPVDHEAAARSLLAEEEADASVASAGKKKRRKRGKRSGAAVKAKANGAAVANGDDESGSEDERDGTAARDANGQGGEDQLRPARPLSEPQNADQALQKQEVASDFSPAVAVAAAAAIPGPTTSTSALEISDEVLGYGSSGTVVFKGKFQSRLVAVKRLLVDFTHLASQEISLLESADDHPNVIRYFYKEQKANFLFIALELCPASLADVVERPDEWKDLAVRLEPKKAIAQIASGLRHLHGLSIVHRDIKPQNILVTYKDPHQPSTSALKMLLSDFGLSKRLDSVAQSSFSQTMHHPGGTAGWRAPEILSGEVSLDEGGSSTSTSTSNSLAGGPAALRSAAPRMRLTRGVDIFALGCVTYYLLTSGDHPFGARYEREVNILRNQKNLSRLGAFGEEGVEASHLIAAMIDCDPTKRPRANQVLAHPYFWDAGKRLAFLQDVSDRLEVIDREKDRTSAQQLASSLVANGMAGSGGGGGGGGSSSRDSFLGPVSSSTSAVAVAESELIRQLEVGAREVTAGGDWTKKVDKAFMDDLGKWRKYHGNSVRDLLRALRNKVSSPILVLAVLLTITDMLHTHVRAQKHHYQDMPPALRRSMGHLPDGFLSYFTRRFPSLFLHVYEVVAKDGFVKSETSFRVSGMEWSGVNYIPGRHRLRW